VEEEFYFHLTKAELVEFQLSVNDERGCTATSRDRRGGEPPGADQALQGSSQMSYGKRSEDGRRFTKNEKILEDFVSTGAYSAALIEILSSTENAIEFFAESFRTISPRRRPRKTGIDPKVTPLMVVEKEKIHEKDLVQMSGEKLGEAMSRIAEGSAEMIFDRPEPSQ
jgi:hypothetical protein